MKQRILSTLIALIMRNLTPELLKTFADQILDWVENAVEESENKLDDATILPLCNMVRKAFDIPD